MLEARDRVRGRVHSYTGGGFSGPIDLGASLITGTATDVAKGLRPDPSAVVARCAPHMLHCAAQNHSLKPPLMHICLPTRQGSMASAASAEPGYEDSVVVAC